MTIVFITGSADGLGLHAARRLIQDGHQVVLHARNPARARDAMKAAPGARSAIHGDLGSLAEMTRVAEEANAIGRFDAVIHNAAVGFKEPRRETADGIEHVFAVNTLAPYVLSALMTRPGRLIYLSSGLNQSGHAELADLNWSRRRWDGMQAYSDTKLHDVMLAFAIARRWKDVLSNSLEPGWVATRMGGPGAPDDLAKGSETQAWLAVSDDKTAMVSGQYFFHKEIRGFNSVARDAGLQDRLLAECERMSGVELLS